MKILEELNETELNLYRKIESKEKIEYEKYFPIIKQIKENYKNSESYDIDSNNFIYLIYRTYDLYKDNEKYINTKYYKKYITFSIK